MIEKLESKQWYQDLNGKVSEAILTYQDKRGYLWENVNLEHLRYFKHNCCGYPFTSHLALILMILSNKNFDPKSVIRYLETIYGGLKKIFQELKLTSFDHFDVNIYLSDYLRGEILPLDSNAMRNRFFSHYKSTTKRIYKWFMTKLTEEQQEVFSSFLLPQTILDSRDFQVGKATDEARKSKRKSETDAIVKDFLKIRAEGGFRLNQVKRLRDKYLEAVKLVESNSHGYSLPFDFSYIDKEERRGMSKELLSFRLWDKPSFVLHHSENYTSATIDNAKKRRSTFSKENNEYFVEFLKAEILDDKTDEPIEEAESFWFLPILEHQLIGIWYQNLKEEQINEKLKIFEMYGYKEPDGEKSLSLSPLKRVF